jgi:hypothetical protein
VINWNTKRRIAARHSIEEIQSRVKRRLFLALFGWKKTDRDLLRGVTIGNLHHPSALY